MQFSVGRKAQGDTGDRKEKWWVLNRAEPQRQFCLERVKGGRYAEIVGWRRKGLWLLLKMIWDELTGGHKMPLWPPAPVSCGISPALLQPELSVNTPSLTMTAYFL